MGILDIEKERLEKEYLELQKNYNVLRDKTHESLYELSKTESDIIEKFISFADSYKKIDCSPEFYEMDGLDSKKENLDLGELKKKAIGFVKLANEIKNKDKEIYAAISLVGMTKILDKACIVDDETSLNNEKLNKLISYLVDISNKVLNKELVTKIDNLDKEGMIKFERNMHSSIRVIKDLTHELSKIKSIADKYNEKLKYLNEIYDHDMEHVREYVDFTGTKNWKELDKNQGALMSIHSNVIVAQLLHDMCCKGIYDEKTEKLDYKNFEKMIERANEVIDVIDVYLKVNVF